MRTRAHALFMLVILVSLLQVSPLHAATSPANAPPGTPPGVPPDKPVGSTPASTGSGWSIAKPPDPWVASTLKPRRLCTAFAVTTRDSPADDVKVYSNLVEQSTKKAITLADLRLCLLSEPCAATKTINLSANTTTNLQLCTTSGFHGTYHGTVTLASRQKPDGDTILQTAQFSSTGAKLAGCLLILVGVYFAWWAKVWSRARLERDQALMPAVFMRSQLAALQETLGRLPAAYSKTPAAIERAIQALLDELADAVLDGRNFLPPTFPNPAGYTVDTAGYKAYLEARNPQIQLLSILVNAGVVAAAGEDDGSLTPQQQAQVNVTIRSIDAISTVNPPPAPEAARTQAANLVRTLHGQLYPLPERAALADARAESTPSPAQEYENLRLEVVSVSKGIWLLYGLLTALSGLAVLILNNPGFGVPLDFVFAFFWGFGLPTTVQTLAPGSAGSALNISVAKS